MNKIELIALYKEYIERHDLPPESCILMAGAACVMHGLRDETNDADMTVPHRFHGRMAATGKFETFTHASGFNLKDGLMDIGSIDHVFQNERPAVCEDGVYYQDLQSVLHMKLRLNRFKDQADIAAIRKAIAAKKQTEKS